EGVGKRRHYKDRQASVAGGFDLARQARRPAATFRCAATAQRTPCENEVFLPERRFCRSSAILSMRNRLLSVFKLSPSTRSVTALTAYAVILAASFYLAYEIRFDFTVPAEFQQERLRFLTYVLAGKLVLL